MQLATESAAKFGDRQTYKMDSTNAREALKEVALDSAEGADVLIVKPALAYIDIIYRVKQATNLPVAAYNVSGEYSMIKAAALNNWIDEKRLVMETLLGIKRAGADLIIPLLSLSEMRSNKKTKLSIRKKRLKLIHGMN